MEQQLTLIETYLSKRDQLNTNVSAVPVAWHLDHSLKVINGICDTLNASDPKTYQPNFSFLRLFCYTFNYIPRGKAKAPKSVRPPKIITTEAILTQLQTAKEKLEKVLEMDDHVHFKHPYFKELNKKQALRFMQLHTEHHLKIVRDILEKKPKS
ncbi:DUF1569 domain-containing protein [Spongiimicrobium salis]|uniref:DUF1569 domain-containing protein n=1 Tax=Spongiimicrobium salis TaxID=1667022 RepID=UPI00374DA93B